MSSKHLIWNCGGFFRRTIDQQDHKPSIGMLKANGTVERHYLDISEDVFEARKEILLDTVMQENSKIKDFLQQLQDLEVESLDFIQAIKNYAAKEERPEMKELLGELVDACHS